MKLREYREYRVVWSSDWLFADGDGEPIDEPGPVSRMLCDTDDLDMARTLRNHWCILAGHLYGQGVITIVDSRGRRVAALGETRSLATAAA